MSVYIYSTLAAGQAYTAYVKNDPKDLAIVERVVHIKGGAHVMDSKNIVTPNGVVTEISDAEYDALKDNYVFKMHVDNGYIKVEQKEVKIDKAVKDMSDQDKSRPLAPKDFKEGKDGKGNKLNRDI